MDEKKILSVLGLCRRAGKLQIGADCVCDAIRSGKAEIVILASDASQNTVKRITDCATFYKKRLIVCGTGKGELGRSLGRSGEVACAAVCEENFAALLDKHLI